MPNKAVQLVQLVRSSKREKRLGTMILFVTSRCNAFCQTCFYHEELNQPGDMTFAQIEKVSRTMPPITDLWLSGGEPTLRRDVPEIIDLFVDQIKQVPPEVLPAMYSHVSRLTNRYGDRMFEDDDASRRFVKNVAYVGAITTHYRTQHANFQQSTAWPFPCTAGETTAVIDYNGDVRACELREKFATLADYDYDFDALWSAHERELELHAIDGGKACWCTHVCFIHDSMRHSRRAMLFDVPKNFLTRESW